MTISGFKIVKNVVSQGYPFLEAILHICGDLYAGAFSSFRDILFFDTFTKVYGNIWISQKVKFNELLVFINFATKTLNHKNSKSYGRRCFEN